MHTVERGIYAAAATRDKRDDLRLRQLCCHLQISEQDRHVIGEKPKTLHEIREIMVKHVYETISSQKTALASYRKKLSEKNAELANNPESKLIPGIENAIRAAKHSISTTEREITQLESEKWVLRIFEENRNIFETKFIMIMILIRTLNIIGPISSQSLTPLATIPTKIVRSAWKTLRKYSLSISLSSNKEH